MKKYQFVLSLTILLLLGLTSCKAPLQEEKAAAGSTLFDTQTESKEEHNDLPEKVTEEVDLPDTEMDNSATENGTEEMANEETPSGNNEGKDDGASSSSHSVVTVNRIPYSKEQLLELAELIVQGTVVKNNGSQDTQTHRTTEYIVKVDEVYKGTCTEETLSVYVDEPLYYVDGKPIVEVPFALEVETECILLLLTIDGKYYPVRSEPGYFPINGEGKFVNDGATTVTLDPNTLAAEIAAVDNSSVVE